MQKTIQIVAEKFNVFVETLKNINKRIAKHGMPAMTFVVDREFMMDVEDFATQVKFMEITINGASPCIAGWNFVAKVEHDDVIGNIVKTFKS